MKDVAVSSGSACTSASLEPSHVLTAHRRSRRSSPTRRSASAWAGGPPRRKSTSPPRPRSRPSRGCARSRRWRAPRVELLYGTRFSSCCSRISSSVFLRTRTSSSGSEGERTASVISGGVGALPALLLAALARELSRSLAVVVASEKDAERLGRGPRAAGLPRVFHAPAPTLTPYQRIPASLKARRDEFSLLSRRSTGSRGARSPRCLPARALFTRLPEPARFAGSSSGSGAATRCLSLPALTERLTRARATGAATSSSRPEIWRCAAGSSTSFRRTATSPCAWSWTATGSRRSCASSTPTRSGRRARGIEERPALRGLRGVRAGSGAARRSGSAGRPRKRSASVFAPAVSAMPAGWLDHAGPRRLRGRRSSPRASSEEIAAFAERVATDRDPDRDAFAPGRAPPSGGSDPPGGSGVAAAVRPPRRRRGRGEPRPAARRGDRRARGPRGREAAEEIAARFLSEARRSSSRRAADGRRREAPPSRASSTSFHVSLDERASPERSPSVPAEISAGFRLREPRLALYAEKEIFGEERRSVAARARPRRLSSRICGT